MQSLEMNNSGPIKQLFEFLVVIRADCLFAHLRGTDVNHEALFPPVLDDCFDLLADVGAIPDVDYAIVI